MDSSKSFSRRSLLKGALGAAGTIAIAGQLIPGTVSAYETQGVVNANGVRLRSGAGTQFGVLAVLPSGTRVVTNHKTETSADGTVWEAVFVGSVSQSGWIAQQYIDWESGPGGEQSTTYPEGTPIVVTDGPLRLRSTANGSVIASLPTNTRATSLGSISTVGGYTWLAISLDSGTGGWVATDFIGKASGGGTPGTGLPAGTAVYVDSSSLNLRSEASLTSFVIDVHLYGTAAEIVSGPTLADGYSWYRVEILSNGDVGYMIGEGLAEGSAGGSPTTDRIVVVDGPVNLRSNAGVSNAVVEVVKQGEGGDLWSTSVPSVDGYSWIRVRIDSTQSIGWLATEFINFV